MDVLDGGKQREENGQKEVLDRWIERNGSTDIGTDWMANQYLMDISINSFTKRLVGGSVHGAKE